MNNKQLPRNWRNCNPLNIKRTAGDKWKGLKEHCTDKTFCEFKSMRYGWRAAFMILGKYYSKYGLQSIGAIIARFAPAAENNVVGYAEWVAGLMGVDRRQPLPPPQDAPDTWKRLAFLMAIYEGGVPTVEQLVHVRPWELEQGWQEYIERL